MQRELVISLSSNVLGHESFDEVILPQLQLLQMRYRKGNLALDRVSIDLGNIVQASSYGILGITVACEILHKMLGRKVNLILPRLAGEGTKKEGTKDFFNKWDYLFFGTVIARVANLRNGSTVLSREQNPIFLPVIKIENWKDVTHLVNELQERFCPFSVEVLGYPVQRGIQFVTVLSELCENILYHSAGDDSIHGYLSFQIHNNGKGSGIEFAVVDTGVGIPNSLRSSHHLVVRYQSRSCGDKETIRLACNANISSKDRGGLGLYMVRKTVEETSGVLYIRSGSAKVLFGNGRQGKGNSFRYPTSFLGTQIGGLLCKGAMDESEKTRSLW